ncbi:MAG: FAD:protein FMN transferase [Sphingomonas taxi]
MRIALPAAIDTGLLAGCDPTAAIIDWGGETMGTRWSVRAVLPAGTDAATIRTAIVARFDGLVAEMSQWQPWSDLSRFNRAAAGSWTVLSPDFAHVIAEALAIAQVTDGAFDPTLGRLVDLWGFGPTPTAAPPQEAAIADALAASGWQRLAYSPSDRRLRQPGGLSLDLSGIAKGFAVDAIADLLGRAGISHALVEIGGELVGRGMRPDGQPWWVDLESPPGLSLGPLRIALHGLAVATSGDYRRGRHTLDPRTGHPIAHGTVAVSVLAPTALAADAWATALTVLPPAAAVALATEHAIAGRIVTTGDGTVEERLTPALRAMLAD